MNPDQWVRVKELFHLALASAPEDRSRFVTEACGGDEQLLEEVDRLLAAHAQAGSFIERSPVSGGHGAAHESGTRPVMTGRVIGRYEVGRLIGVGGMGEVYAARDVELGREVALKIATGEGVDSQTRLRREAQHASQLNHPHICTVHEVGAVDGRPYIVMELVGGQRLSDVIVPDGLPLETGLRYGVQIADALAHAHRHGVTHRDLKSANIMITPDGRAKVLDFGLARRLPTEQLEELSQSRDSLTAEGMISGTLAYMAPELIRGEEADARSDLWALGVLLHEMATGTRPFEGATGFELSAAILHEPPAPLRARIPASLEQIIRRCLAKNPRERYRQADEVSSALEAVGAEGSGAIRRGRTRMAVAALVVALALVAALAWRGVRPSTTPASIGTSGRPAIAVMPFERVGGEQDPGTAWMSSGVPTMLLTGLAQTRGLDIVSSERLQDALKRRRGGTSLAALDKSQAADVARQAGAGVVVVGSIFRVGPEIRIDARLEDLVSGRVLAAHSVRGTDLFVLIDQLASLIRDGVGLPEARDVRRVAEVSTSSLEAFKLYSLGNDAVINSRMDDAQKLFEDAVGVDPAFAEAYQQLAAIMNFRGLPRRRREYLRKAEEHSDRLSERRQLLLNAQLAFDAGNVAETEGALDELLTKFPDVGQAYAFAFRLYTPRPGRAGNIQKLLRILAAGVAALPTTGDTHNGYGYSLIEARRYGEAIREFETYVRLAPREPNPYDSLGEGHLLAGEAGKAVESYSRALAIDPTFDVAHNGRAWSLAALGRYDEAVVEKPPIQSLRAFIGSRVGRDKEAAEAIDAGIRQAIQNEDIPEHAWLMLASSVLAIERKDYERALQNLQSAERMVAGLPQEQRRVHLRLATLLSGIAQLGAGRLDAARAHLDSQRRLGEPAGDVERWWSKALEGEIALAGGDLQEAAAAFSAGEPAGRMWFSLQQRTVSLLANNLTSRDGLARVARARGDLKGAIQIYRRLLIYGPDQKWVAAFEPRHVLEIARLLDQTDDKGAARQEYQRFLEFWRHADPDLPELAEVRRALARIPAPVKTTP